MAVERGRMLIIGIVSQSVMPIFGQIHRHADPS